jgi:hypothetical protein
MERPSFSSLSQTYREYSFSQPPSPLKVYKSSEKNYDGGRFNEIKYADPGRTGDRHDRTSFRAGSLGRHDIHQYMY